MADITTGSNSWSPSQNLRERLHNTVRQFAHVERDERVAKDALEIARELAPEHPVLCFSHTALERRAKLFLNEFPGFVTYAVKANSQTCILSTLSEAGIRGFDVASIPEIQAMRTIQPDAELHYHNPAKSVREIETAYHTYGVRHFAVDHEAELEKLTRLTDPKETTIAIRFRLNGDFAAHDFTTKFGVAPDVAIELADKVKSAGFTPTLTFHPGSQCYSPDAYAAHIHAAADIARAAKLDLTHLNVGGGFPAEFPGENLPPLQKFFDDIRTATLEAFGSNAPELACEPGRAMVATAMSLLVQVKLVRRDLGDLFMSDGMYGGLLEPTQVDIMPPARLIRDGVLVENEATRPFTVYGPTCDPQDTMHRPVYLPESVQDGDFIEFGLMGGYSSATSTKFNGYGDLETIAVENAFTV